MMYGMSELPPKPRLSVWSDVVPGPPRLVSLAGRYGTFIVGYDDGCDLVLKDRLVSSEHAAFHLLRGGKILIEDRGSTDGTYVDKMRVRGTHELQNGDTVRIGDTFLELDAPMRPRSSPPRELQPPPPPGDLQHLIVAVRSVDQRIGGEWEGHTRTRLDELVAEEISGTKPRTARDALDALCRRKGVPLELRGAARLQRLADILCGRI